MKYIKNKLYFKEINERAEVVSSALFVCKLMRSNSGLSFKLAKLISQLPDYESGEQKGIGTHNLLIIFVH